ncbi:hypothetical protein ACLMJK_008258 [Lecanora helva]
MSDELLWKVLEKDPSEALPRVQNLIDQGVAVDGHFQDILLTTPLHKAAESQDPEMIDLLLEKGAPINALNAFSFPPIQRAISLGRLEICKILLDRGADVDRRGREGDSMLELAVGNEHPAIVELLLDHGLDANSRDKWGGPMIISAVMIDYQGTREAAGMTLVEGAEVDMRHINGATAMHMAAEIGDIKTVKILLDAGADANALDDSYRQPLWFAARDNRVEIVKLLLETTEDIDNQDCNGHTSLSCAARRGHSDCRYGQDALTWALDRGDTGATTIRDGGDLDDASFRLILAAGVEREKNTPNAQFKEWSEILDRAEPHELKELKEGIQHRCNLFTTPESVAFREEVRQDIDRQREEKKKKIFEEAGIDGIERMREERRQQILEEEGSVFCEPLPEPDDTHETQAQNED